jgi:hypothetical protein
MQLSGSLHKHLVNDSRRGRGMARNVRCLLLVTLALGALMIWTTYTLVRRCRLLLRACASLACPASPPTPGLHTNPRPQESPYLAPFLGQERAMGCCSALRLKRLRVFSTLNPAWGKAFPRIQVGRGWLQGRRALLPGARAGCCCCWPGRGWSRGGLILLSLLAKPYSAPALGLQGWGWGRGAA